MTHAQDGSTLVIVDAIDGAGKYTTVKAMADQLARTGLRIFNLSEYMRTNHRLPEINETIIEEADVLISSEPTLCWIGAAIRDEIVHTHTDRAWSARTAAEAFALDRWVLFSRLIIPFLKARPNRYVLQERGVVSSLAYQPLQDPSVTLEWMLSLEGNRVELSRPPDLLLLLRLTSTEAMRRISGRGDKVDGHIYEETSFQERLIARYRDPAVLEPYVRAGTKIVEIDASRSPEEVGESACKELQCLHL